MEPKDWNPLIDRLTADIEETRRAVKELKRRIALAQKFLSNHKMYKGTDADTAKKIQALLGDLQESARKGLRSIRKS